MFGDNGTDACKRREERREVELGAVIHRRDGSCTSAEVHDLSYEGCRISGSGSLEPAERIRLVVPALGEIEAQVRWSASGRAGAQFGSGGAWGFEIEAPKRSALSHARHFNYGSRRSFGRKRAAA